MSSSKSSLRSARSFSSSAGETNASSYSTGTSSTGRHRRANAAGYNEPRVVPQKMSAPERLHLVRNAITRLEYVCEREMHMAALDQAGGDAVDGFFDKLRGKLPKWHYNPRRVGTPAEGGPRTLQYLAKEVDGVRKAAQEIETALAAEARKVAGAAPAAVYDGNKQRHLREAVGELEELQTLLSGKTDEMLTRVNTELLSDLVSFHVNEFDAFAGLRVESFAREMANEGAHYAGAVMSDASQRATPIGIASIQMLDVAIGVRPGRCARMVLEHATQRVTKVENRILHADKVLQDANLAALSEAERTSVEAQKREYTMMKDRAVHALREFACIKARWEDEEQSLFQTAASGSHDLGSLLFTKQLKEGEVVEEVQGLHDRAIHACLPFAAPQYHRRAGETYSQPCHVRLGLHFISSYTPHSLGAAATAAAAAAMHGRRKRDEDEDQEEVEEPADLEAASRRGAAATRGRTAVTLYTLMPEFLPLMRQMNIPASEHQRYSYLVPSKEQLWVPFSEFPEMVKGARCALRGVDTRLDHFRALEEQKEVGGYFIMRGGERILRALMMQRCDVPINIERDKFQTQGPNFSNKAVVIRCKRPSGLTAQNYFYYTTVGEVIFSFARKVVWHIPVPLLLCATSTQSVSSVELYRLLTVGMPGGSHPARVEALLQHHRQKPYGALTNFLDYITVIGRMYREYHQNSNTFHFLPQFARGAAGQHDAWYGVFMLRRHVLPHLNVDCSTPDLTPAATTEELRAWLPAALLEELDKKFEALLAITRQLYGFTDGETEHQGNDVPAYQELFTVSQVLAGAFEVCLNKYLKAASYSLGRHLTASLFNTVIDRLPGASTKDATETLRQVRQFADFAIRRGGSEPLDMLYRLLITGNMTLDREEDFYCPQTSGWVVMAEHLNFYRFFEQLRCVHRGKTVAGMRSSEVRKYPCEAYGFICMVHSPDGEDCGVLNHLSVATIMANSACRSLPSLKALRTEVDTWLVEDLPRLRNRRRNASVADRLMETVPVWVEGEVVGYVSPADAAAAAQRLRVRKAVGDKTKVGAFGEVRRDDVTTLNTLEVVYVAPGNKDPRGLYLFYDCGRLMRPVQRMEDPGGKTVAAAGSLAFPLVYVGTWEQTWLDIASVPSDPLDAIVQLNKKFEFMEQNGSNIISLTSATIPFFEYNCSPRNLFQCGLSKQSAGTQLQALAWRKEAKLFRMYAPQRYISRTLSMDAYNLDDVNLGVNAVVAILAYTGYDLDDALILNSTASQRGMLGAGITVAKIVTASGKGEDDDTFVFHNMLSTGERFTPELNANGLPPKRSNPSLEDSFNFDRDHKYPGLADSSAVYCCAKRVERVDPFTNERVHEYTQHHVSKWRSFDKGENAWVHQVVPLTYEGPDVTSALMVFRIPRPPEVGDKFSSRHGQKGTLPLHIRSHDLPFSTRSGITPDVIINPHAFPSRMTVGMVLEMMAAKVGAVEGRFMDNSAWNTVDDKPRVAADIGEALAQIGYNRHGREHLIDGISGEEMEADVFMGISGYQRLRHMVNDKWQARARTDAHTFRAVTRTGQPVKGRKRHGGVRVGEMERDGLLSHGISEVVLDRLLHVSDKTKAFVCPNCGSLLSIYEKHATEYSTWKCCKFCRAGADESTDNIALVEIPQVLRLWAAELTSIGIRVTLKTSEHSAFN